MTTDAGVGRSVALVVTGDDELADRVQASIAETTDGLVGSERATDVATAASIGGRVRDLGGIVPVAFVHVAGDGDDFEHGEMSVDDVVAIHAAPPLTDTRIVLVSRAAILRDIDRALRADAVHGMLTVPWTPTGFAHQLTAHLATYLVEHAPDRIDAFDALLDDDDRRRAERRIELRRDAPPLAADRPHPLLDTSSEDAELEAQLVEMIDRALGHPPRIRVAPGTVLIEIDDDVGGIYVLLDGEVRLTSRTPTGEQVLHRRSTGSILGLLSLASRRRAILRCTALTDVRAIPITLDQLAHALQVEPELSGLLNRVLIGSLARRLRRSDALQVELDQSLAALSAARAELVSTARLRTLGEISAGLAHELNNPTAALLRTLDHIEADLTEHGVVEPALVEVVERQRTAPIASTTEVRRRRRDALDAVGDRQVADRLAAIGFTDAAEARRLAALPADELARMEAAARLGTALRDAASAARRVQGLVDSLRSYARGDDEGGGAPVPDVDIARTIRSAVRLVSHRADGIEIDLRLADVAPIVGRPGPLQSVWTNLLTNALDAFETPDGVDDAEPATAPRVVIELDQYGADRVRVRVSDNGPGIPAELIDRIFEPRFTTKGGRVRFGLGLGLSITRQIVGDHDGTIDVESRPGRTVFTVLLPVEGPDA